MSARSVVATVLFLFLLACLVVIGQASLNQLACEGQPINIRLTPTSAQQIWGDHIIGQSFVAPRNDLNRIDILFQTYQRQNSHDVTLSLSQMPADSDYLHQGSKLVEFTFNASTVRDQSWRTFTFPPIPNTAGKTHLLTLQSTQSISGNAITVGGTEWDVYAPGLAFLGSTPLLADMAFRTCYQMTTREKLEVLSWQITQNRPGLWAHIETYWISMIVYGLLLTGFFWKLARLTLS